MPLDLVIDASVARAAGNDGAAYPSSKLTRDSLQAVLDNSHFVVMSPEIIAEWNQHQSTFARLWRLSMTARRRVRRIESQFNAVLRDRLRVVARTENEWAETEKDCILVEAALATDRTVISLDETARELFVLSSRRVGELRTLVWVNPAKPNDLAVEWIVAGCAAERARRLGAAE